MVAMFENMTEEEVLAHVKEIERAIPRLGERPLVDCEFAPIVARHSLVTFYKIRALTERVAKIQLFMDERMPDMVRSAVSESEIRILDTVNEMLEKAIEGAQPKGFLGGLQILTHAQPWGAVAFTAFIAAETYLRTHGTSLLPWLIK